jgi:hypothetical protein
VDSSSFINCRGVNLGGVVRYFVNSEIKRSIFDRCKTSSPDNSEGGAIHVEKSDLNISDSTFTGCTTFCGGGAISFSKSNILIIKNTRFLFCESYKANNNIFVGGAIRTYNVGGTFYNCSFINCRSGMYGGAIGYANSTSNSKDSINLNNCTFISNFGNNGSGAVYSFLTLQCTNCSFLHNSAVNYGTIVCANSSFIDTVFVRGYVNTCGNGGGAVFFLFLASGSSTFKNCTFIQNRVISNTCNSFILFFISVCYFNRFWE